MEIELRHVLQEYSPKKLAGCASSTEEKYLIAIGHLSVYLGRNARVSDLTDDTIQAWAWWLVKKQGLAIDTASGYHAKLLALWRFACRKGHLSIWPDHSKLRVPDRIPIAWSRSQVAKLFQACERQTGYIGGVPARLWWHTLHAAIWDTAERISAILATAWTDLDLEEGWLVVRAENRKGKRQDKAWRLHPDTVALLRKFELPARDLVWPFPHDRATLWNRYTRLLESAGLPADRKHKFHCLRKSVASYFEAAGGNATELLGHSSRAVTQRYLAPQIVTPMQASDLLFRPGTVAAIG